MLAALRTNALTIEQLSPTTNLADGDSFEVSGEKRVSVSSLRSILTDPIRDFVTVELATEKKAREETDNEIIDALIDDERRLGDAEGAIQSADRWRESLPILTFAEIVADDVAVSLLGFSTDPTFAHDVVFCPPKGNFLLRQRPYSFGPDGLVYGDPLYFSAWNRGTNGLGTVLYNGADEYRDSAGAPRRATLFLIPPSDGVQARFHAWDGSSLRRLGDMADILRALSASSAMVPFDGSTIPMSNFFTGKPSEETLQLARTVGSLSVKFHAAVKCFILRCHTGAATNFYKEWDAVADDDGAVLIPASTDFVAGRIFCSTAEEPPKAYTWRGVGEPLVAAGRPPKECGEIQSQLYRIDETLSDTDDVARKALSRIESLEYNYAYDLAEVREPIASGVVTAASPSVEHKANSVKIVFKTLDPKGLPGTVEAVIGAVGIKAGLMLPKHAE